MTTDSGKRNRLIILVGTSIFSSASWRLDDLNDPFVQQLRDDDETCWTGYQQWSSEKLLQSPKSRSDMCLYQPFCNGTAVNAWLEVLSRTNREELSLKVATDQASMTRHFLRYSAEVSTLLKLWALDFPSEDFRTFLGRYASIELLYSQHDSLQTDAALLVRDVLDRLADPLPHSGIELNDSVEGKTLSEQSVSICHHLYQTIHDGRVDLIVSGGYKIFAVGSAFAFGRAYQLHKHRRAVGETLEPWDGRRLIYLHESDDGLLVRQDGHKLYIENELTEEPSPEDAS